MHPAFTNPEKLFGYSYVKEKNFRDTEGHIEIGSDVWIGNNVLIMDGVKIGDGAVVGAGALVTKDIEPYSINAGIPARKIRYRFDGETIKELLRLRWWDRGEVWIKKHIDEFTDAKELLKTLDKGSGEPAE
ncbi:MAG: CatB-related O-acetyltransferase [Lachnospiraceae bacterium]|nr:CatB-related O-acetyltransferase [Lachnospiraceae bacterium]